jgi:hypothetical protein
VDGSVRGRRSMSFAEMALLSDGNSLIVLPGAK